MKLEGEYLFEAPIQEVWDALFDPRVLAAVMPGCEKLEREGGQLTGELNIKVGPVQGKFAGKVDLKDIDEPRSYTMVIDGRGSSGFVKATASVKLQTEGDHTRMRYSADAQVGGKLASVGQRLVEVSARAISKQSLEGLHENVKIRAAAAAQAAATSAAETAPQEAKAPVAEEPKVPVVVEPKAAVADEAKAPVAEESKAAVSDESKDAVVEKVKAPVVEESKVPVAEESKETVREEPKAAIVQEPKAPVAEEPKAPARPATPAPVLKTVSQADMAAAVAKEVTREFLPTPVRIALVLVALGAVVLILWRALA